MAAVPAAWSIQPTADGLRPTTSGQSRTGVQFCSMNDPPPTRSHATAPVLSVGRPEDGEKTAATLTVYVPGRVRSIGPGTVELGELHPAEVETIAPACWVQVCAPAGCEGPVTVQSKRTGMGGFCGTGACQFTCAANVAASGAFIGAHHLPSLGMVMVRTTGWPGVGHGMHGPGDALIETL